MGRFDDCLAKVTDSGVRDELLAETAPSSDQSRHIPVCIKLDPE